MAFQYVLTFTLLIIEMVLFALISLPLPSKLRRPLLNTLSIPFHSQQFQMIMKCVFVFIGIMFLDSINRTNKISNELNGFLPNPNNDYSNIGGGLSRAEIQSRRFYSQRNMYLCGFTLFLSLILNRTYSMVFELLEIKEKIAKVKVENSGKVNNNVDNSVLLEKIQQLKDEKEVLLKKSKALSDEY